MILRAIEENSSLTARRVALGAMALCALVILASGWRLRSVRAETADLRLQLSGRQGRLAENRRVSSSVPQGPEPDALDRSRAVSKFRATLATLAKSQGCRIDEFQASTEEAPFLTTYAADNKDPGWMQVPIRLQLGGGVPAIMATVAELRKLDVPFEIDSLELTRRATDNSGKATVAAGIALRVLVYRGEA